MRSELKGMCLLIVAAVLSLGPGGSAQTLHLLPHQKIVLKNGLTVLLLEKHGVPLVDIAAIVKTGAAGDPEGEAGLAATTAQLLRKGTKSRSAQQFSSDLDFIGGSFSANAGPDFTSITAEFLSKDIDKGLNLFADAVLHPTFPQNETDKLLAQNIDTVKASKDDPQQVIGEYYDAYLFGANPYGHPREGDENSLKRIRREGVVNFYQANYGPQNTILAVAGEFNGAELRKKLEETLGNWSGAPAKMAAVPAFAEVKGKRLLLVDKPDATQMYFAIGNVGIKRNDPDRVACYVVNTLFGGRFTSELNEALRVESGYTYGAFSFFDERKAAGVFEISSFTKNETTIPAIDLALKVLHKLHEEGVTAEQLKSAKSFIKGQFPPTIETSQQLARLIASNEFYGLDDSEINELEARVDAVTPEIARQMIQKHFPEDNLVFVLIGNASAIGSGVQKYAEKHDARSISEPGFWTVTETK